MSATPLETFFYQLDRSRFMDDYKSMAPLDRALPIGFGQTISQPSLVLDMTRQLALQPDSRVLEIGTGSGYQTCLLAQFSKIVYTLERIAPLSERARERLEAMGFDNIRFIIGDGSTGWPAAMPYDRIMVTAAASQVPEELTDQLAPEGIMIIPVGDAGCQHILKVIKDSEGQLSATRLEAVRFVPFVGKYSI